MRLRHFLCRQLLHPALMSILTRIKNKWWFLGLTFHMVCLGIAVTANIVHVVALWPSFFDWWVTVDSVCLSVCLHCLPESGVMSTSCCAICGVISDCEGAGLSQDSASSHPQRYVRMWPAMVGGFTSCLDGNRAQCLSPWAELKLS
jgi:hypothetical protein